MTQSRDREASGPTRDSVRSLKRDGTFVLAAAAVFGAGFAVAYGVDRRAIEAATFAFAAVAAFAALAILRVVRATGGRQQGIMRAVAELEQVQRRLLADAVSEQPSPTVLFLVDGNAGVERARLDRIRPRPLDLEQVIAHERTLALKTLPPAKAPLPGALRIYREPSEEDREGFREQVARYAATLREALEAYDAYRAERALLVRGRFRFENQSRRSAYDLTVRAYFPDPFGIVRAAPVPPALPRRPTFHAKRAGLAALVGGDHRRNAAPDQVVPASERSVSRVLGNVSRPRYRQGSAVVEVGVERLQQSVPADMADEDCWVLRLPRPGAYRIPWEISGADFDEPVRGELWLEVTERLDDMPIRSVKELVAEEQAAALDARLR
jgi:hypothetical protein